MKVILWLTIFMPLVGISWARPQFLDSEERHLHRHHHRRPSFGGSLHNGFNQQGQPFGPQNGFGGGNFGSLLGGGGGPATGIGLANAGNGANANGVGIAQPPPGGIGLGLGIGLALSTPFGNIALSDGESFAAG